MRLCPTRKPKKRENEWVGTHSKGQKKLNRVGLHPLVRIKLFQSSGEENRVKIKKVYFHSQNLQYMQNLQRECSHSFLKKAAFRVGLYPLENRKNVKTSGLVPTRNNKKSLIEWVYTHSNLLKIHKRVDLHPLENRKTWKRVGLHTYTPTHLHARTFRHSPHSHVTPILPHPHLDPHSPHLPLPKKISKAIHIATPLFSKK